MEHGPLMTCFLGTSLLLVAMWSQRVPGFRIGKSGEQKLKDVPLAGYVEQEAVEPGQLSSLHLEVRRSAHTSSVEEMEVALGSRLAGASLMGSTNTGLDEGTAAKRLQACGENRLTPPERESRWVLLLKQIFGGLFNIMLWVCVVSELVLALFLSGDDLVTPVVLAGVIVASATLQWWTELQAESMMNALQSMQAHSPGVHAPGSRAPLGRDVSGLASTGQTSCSRPGMRASGAQRDVPRSFGRISKRERLLAPPSSPPPGGELGHHLPPPQRQVRRGAGPRRGARAGRRPLARGRPARARGRAHPRLLRRRLGGELRAHRRVHAGAAHLAGVADRLGAGGGAERGLQRHRRPAGEDALCRFRHRRRDFAWADCRKNPHRPDQVSGLASSAEWHGVEGALHELARRRRPKLRRLARCPIVPLSKAPAHAHARCPHSFDSF